MMSRVTDIIMPSKGKVVREIAATSGDGDIHLGACVDLSIAASAFGVLISKLAASAISLIQMSNTEHGAYGGDFRMLR